MTNSKQTVAERFMHAYHISRIHLPYFTIVFLFRIKLRLKI